MKSVVETVPVTPQARKVLAHMLQHGDITPLKAQAVYGIHRLSARIYELRRAGWDISAVIERSPSGQPYATYQLLREVA